MDNQINYEDFKKIDLRIGQITSCEVLPDSDNLLRLAVDFGPLGKKKIIAGLGKWYDCSEFVDKQAVFVVNLAPKMIRGEESQGMILAVSPSVGEKPYILIPEYEVENGDVIH